MASLHYIQNKKLTCISKWKMYLLHEYQNQAKILKIQEMSQRFNIQQYNKKIIYIVALINGWYIINSS